MIELNRKLGYREVRRGPTGDAVERVSMVKVLWPHGLTTANRLIYRPEFDADCTEGDDAQNLAVDGDVALDDPHVVTQRVERRRAAELLPGGEGDVRPHGRRRRGSARRAAPPYERLASGDFRRPGRRWRAGDRAAEGRASGDLAAPIARLAVTRSRRDVADPIPRCR
ncbi:hypothetical protein [Nannocystis exedens]|uniref:hypothetical protein n=1 Tax=Nannocystis exedens TaxID=54 RepID=UPI001160DE24|nr:hypothetical protein [Nannocystis exedens]